MTGTPQPASREFFTELNALTREQVRTPFYLARLEKMARALLKANACIGYQALGAIAAFQEKPQESREFHEKSLRIGPHDPNAWNNYSASLTRMGFLSEAVDAARNARDNARGVAEYSSRYVTALMQCGLVQTAALTAESVDAGDDNLIGTKEFANLLTERGVQERDTALLLKIATTVLHRNGQFFVNSGVMISEDEDSAFLSYALHIDQDVQGVLRLQDEYIDAVIDSNISPVAVMTCAVRFSTVIKKQENNADRRTELA